jgi:hypothetical protein
MRYHKHLMLLETTQFLLVKLFCLLLECQVVVTVVVVGHLLLVQAVEVLVPLSLLET